MGVPKFYRWISERYPNISRVCDCNQLPEIDNFYLDMNGIIHTCSHVNEDNCQTIVTEKEIFQNIFHYIDFLFRMIKPKKVFYMAIDGVAPRAKMNQQRSRRFRSGQDRVKNLTTIAQKQQISFDELVEQHFDTNAITPGTEFMERLDQQLKYFIHWKINTDPLWDDIEIHLSGHLTPGEGEHKIMEYIRYTRSQPDYDMNTRHCLYGLDADLIMLSLVTHETHFVLLREQVQYSAKRSNRILSPEEIKWDLFYTSILRDYIDLEFRSLKEELKFPYELTSIIDDWILIGYLVGNDFIPHLPHIHIQEEALTILWDAYKKVLPQLDGYLNEHGDLNLRRFERYIAELSIYDHQRYANENDTFRNVNNRRRQRQNTSQKKSENLEETGDDDFNFGALEKLNEPISIDVTASASSKNKSSTSKTNEDDHFSENSESQSDGTETGDEDQQIEPEHLELKPIDEDDLDKMPLIEAEFRQHKNYYYREKMRIDFKSSSELKPLVEEYIIALQWILRYYYQSCPSWSWFYPRHYAPYLSDLKNFQDLKIDFVAGKPFKPFEQLLAVLPPSSKSLLVKPLQNLMIDEKSPLLKFYPEKFEIDQNEKKHSWESIVLLPFIDEKLLVDSMSKVESLIEANDRKRNEVSGSFCFRSSHFSSSSDAILRKNPLFPPINVTRALSREIPSDFYHLEKDRIRFGKLSEGKEMIFENFPFLHGLPFFYALKRSVVNVFKSFSKSDSLVLKLNRRVDSDFIDFNESWTPGSDGSRPFEIKNLDGLVERYLGRRVFFDWPHFRSGIVCAVSDMKNLFVWSNFSSSSSFDIKNFNAWGNEIFRDSSFLRHQFDQQPFEVDLRSKKNVSSNKFLLSEEQTQLEYKKAMEINRIYQKHRAIDIGPIPLILYVCPTIGHRFHYDETSGSMKVVCNFSNCASAFPLQTSLLEIKNYRENFNEIPASASEFFKTNEKVFILEKPFFGRLATINQVKTDQQGNCSAVCQVECSTLFEQPDLYQMSRSIFARKTSYFTAQQAAEQIACSPLIIAKITGRINIFYGKKRSKRSVPTNLGLSWKLNRPLKILDGYTKKVDGIWYYSQSALEIVKEYFSKFPELFVAIGKEPDREKYYEQSIWENDGRSKIQEIRLWIKSLPCFSIELIDGSSQILDLAAVQEVERCVKQFYEENVNRNSSRTEKMFTFGLGQVFKPSEALGLSQVVPGTEFQLLDRVINVRLETSVPLGAFGTLIGIIPGQNYLETTYEVLFDELNEIRFEKSIIDRSTASRRIRVKSHQLINFSYSVRADSNSAFFRASSLTPDSSPFFTETLGNPIQTGFQRQTSNLNPNATPFVPNQ